VKGRERSGKYGERGRKGKREKGRPNLETALTPMLVISPACLKSCF